MRNVKKLSAGVGVAAATLAAVAVSGAHGAAATTSPLCSFSSLTTSSWNNGASQGYTESVKVTNLSSAPVTNWTIAWNVGPRRQVTKLWTATWTQAGRRVHLASTPSNATIYAGKTISLGYTATGAARGARVLVLDGARCSRTT